MGMNYAASNNNNRVAPAYAMDALSYYGYLGTAIGFNEDNIVSSINAGKPVYLASANNAWICEGTQRGNYHYEFQLMMLSDVEPPLQYVSWVQPYDTDYGSIAYLYYNLGNFGSGDGWYVSNYFGASQSLIGITPH